MRRIPGGTAPKPPEATAPRGGEPPPVVREVDAGEIRGRRRRIAEELRRMQHALFASLARARTLRREIQDRTKELLDIELEELPLFEQHAK